MVIPLRIASRDRVLTSAEKSRIEQLTEGLAAFFPRILSCEVHVEGPGARHRQGVHQARLVITVPTRRIVISRQKSGTLPEALGEAFRAAARRLEDHARKIRGDVKGRAGAQTGCVLRLFSGPGYGFIEADGREIYFHRNSVRRPGFERLAVGTRVRFSEETGIDGPQASTVSMVAPRRVRRA